MSFGVTSPHGISMERPAALCTTARDDLNVIKQRHNLVICYSETVNGPQHSQVWFGWWSLQGVGDIGRANATSKAGAKEESARMAVEWLVQAGY